MESATLAIERGDGDVVCRGLLAAGAKESATLVMRMAVGQNPAEVLELQCWSVHQAQWGYSALVLS